MLCFKQILYAIWWVKLFSEILSLLHLLQIVCAHSQMCQIHQKGSSNTLLIQQCYILIIHV